MPRAESDGARPPNPLLAASPHALQDNTSRPRMATKRSDTGCLLCAEIDAIARENLPCLPDKPEQGGDEAKSGGQAVLFDEPAWRPGFLQPKEEKETKLNERQKVAKLMLETINIRFPLHSAWTLGASLELDPSGEDALVVKDIVGDGLVSDWNVANAGAEIRSGDRILAVNGRHASAEALRAALGVPGEVSEITVLQRRVAPRKARVSELPVIHEHEEVPLVERKALSPPGFLASSIAWSTSWVSAEHKEKLRSAGACLADAPRSDSKPFDAGDVEPPPHDSAGERRGGGRT